MTRPTVQGLACVLAAFALGCGSGRVSLNAPSDAATGNATVDRGAETETEAPAEASSVDVESPNVLCTAGDYFIEVTDDAGTRALRSGCADSGVDVPSLSTVLCAEDLQCFYLTACGGAASVQLQVRGGIYGYAWFSFDDGDGGTYSGGGPIHFSNAPPQLSGLPWEGGTIAGDYEADLPVEDDAGVTTAVSRYSGRFCVHP
jgi:hypothetical protein